MIVNFVMKPSSLNIFCKTMLILAIKVKKDGNVNYAKPSLKLKAQWNNTLNQFMKEYEIKFVSYAERHLFVNLTWIHIWNLFMKEKGGFNVLNVKNAINPNKPLKAILRQLMKETSHHLSASYVRRVLLAHTLWSDTLKLFTRRKNLLVVMFAQHASDKNLIWSHIWKLFTVQCKF